MDGQTVRQMDEVIFELRCWLFYSVGGAYEEDDAEADQIYDKLDLLLPPSIYIYLSIYHRLCYPLDMSLVSTALYGYDCLID